MVVTRSQGRIDGTGCQDYHEMNLSMGKLMTEFKDNFPFYHCLWKRRENTSYDSSQPQT
jgi:hypothetical protein